MQSSSKLEWLLQAYEPLLLGGKEWAGLFFPPTPYLSIVKSHMVRSA